MKTSTATITLTLGSLALCNTRKHDHMAERDSSSSTFSTIAPVSNRFDAHPTPKSTNTNSYTDLDPADISLIQQWIETHPQALPVHKLEIESIPIQGLNTSELMQPQRKMDCWQERTICCCFVWVFGATAACCRQVCDGLRVDE